MDHWLEKKRTTSGCCSDKYLAVIGNALNISKCLLEYMPVSKVIILSGLFVSILPAKSMPVHCLLFIALNNWK